MSSRLPDGTVLWNVEQAMDHAFPDWRQQPALTDKKIHAKIQGAFRTAAVVWARSTDPQDTQRSAVMPRSLAFSKVQHIVQAVIARQIALLSQALDFVLQNIAGPHIIADEDDDEMEEGE